MLLKFLIIILLIFPLIWGQNDEISEACIRCLCHARTGCYQLKNCAKYSINRDYWEIAGSPTYLDDSPNDPDAFKNCQNNDGCILRTITGYVNSIGLRDCNCDNHITCKDYFAVHLHGAGCNKPIPGNYLSRFDRCIGQKNIQNSPGWSITASCAPRRYNEEVTPAPV